MLLVLVRDRAAGGKEKVVSLKRREELARARPSLEAQCPLCHEFPGTCRADPVCYAFGVVGPSGLIAAPVFGRAVRVDGTDDAGEVSIDLAKELGMVSREARHPLLKL